MANNNLVGAWAYPSEKYDSSSVMMKFPTEWKKKENVPNHQPVKLCFSNIYIYSAYMSRGLLIKQATHIHPLISGDWWAQNISPVALQLINVDIWAQHF